MSTSPLLERVFSWTTLIDATLLDNKIADIDGNSNDNDHHDHHHHHVSS